MAWGKDELIIDRRVSTARLVHQKTPDSATQTKKSTKSRRKESKNSSKHRRNSSGSSLSVIYETTKQDSQLELVALRQKERKLQKKLAQIEAEKQSELNSIHQALERRKVGLSQLSLVDQELYFRDQEIEQLQQENAALSAKNEKLATSMRKLRVKNSRLYEFSHGNRDHYKMLRMHHTRAKEENERLMAQEKHYKKKIEKLHEDLQEGTDFIYAEHRLKLKLRHTAHKVASALASRDKGSLHADTMKIFQNVIGHESKALEPVPFPPKVDAHLPKVTSRKRRGHRKLRKSKSFSEKALSSARSSSPQQRTRRKRTSRRSGSGEDKSDRNLHDSWNTV